jgi:hypothetical protein
LGGHRISQEDSENFESRITTITIFRVQSDIDDPQYQKGTDYLDATCEYCSNRIAYAACRIYRAYQAAWPYTTKGVRIQSPDPFSCPSELNIGGNISCRQYQDQSLDAG